MKTGWHTLQELFHTALQRAPEDRDAFLDERCGADIALRHGIRLLFAREGSGSGFGGQSTIASRARAVERR